MCQNSPPFPPFGSRFKDFNASRCRICHRLCDVLERVQSGNQSPPQTGNASGCLPFDILHTQLPTRIEEICLKCQCRVTKRRQALGVCVSETAVNSVLLAALPLHTLGEKAEARTNHSATTLSTFSMPAVTTGSGVVDASRGLHLFSWWDFQIAGALKCLPEKFRDAKHRIYFGKNKKKSK